MNQEKQTSGISITGLVIGIISVVLCWVPILHFILGALAIIFGGIATAKKSKYGLVGLILGIASFVLGWGMIIIITASNL